MADSSPNPREIKEPASDQKAPRAPGGEAAVKIDSKEREQRDGEVLGDEA